MVEIDLSFGGTYCLQLLGKQHNKLRITLFLNFVHNTEKSD